ncbi:Methyltransferase-like protein, partial [Ooceraea biroi]
GRYICISLLQEHVLRKLLSYFPTSNRCHAAELKARKEGDCYIPIFMIIAMKFKNLPQKLLEIALVDGPPERLSSIEDMISAVFSTQQVALVHNKLRKSNIANIGEITLDLHRPGDKHPRYTVYIIDCPSTSCGTTFAAYIVPQGKDSATNLALVFLSSNDIGTRGVCYDSGQFVVEDVEDEDYELRRLVFLDNPYVIQSEARLKEGTNL